MLACILPCPIVCIILYNYNIFIIMHFYADNKLNQLVNQSNNQSLNKDNKHRFKECNIVKLTFVRFVDRGLLGSVIFYKSKNS